MDLSSELSMLSRSPSPLPHLHGDPWRDPSPPPSQPQKKLRRRPSKRRSIQQKTDDVLDILRKRSLSLFQFLEACKSQSERTTGPSYWRNFLKKLHEPDNHLYYSLVHDKGTLELDDSSQKRERVAVLAKEDFMCDLFRKEMLNIPKTVDFYSPCEAQDLGSFQDTNMVELAGRLEQVAPCSSRLFRSLLHPYMAQKKTGKTEKEEGEETEERDAGYLISIFGILCYSQQKKKACGLQTRLAAYLHCNATKSSVIEVFHRCGLSIGRSKLQSVLQERQAQGKQEIRRIGREPTAVLQYDNLEQLQRVREQRQDSNDRHISVTTGYLIKGVDMSETGLANNMINFNIPLQRSDVLDAPGLSTSDPCMRQVRYSLHPS